MYLAQRLRPIPRSGLEERDPDQEIREPQAAIPKGGDRAATFRRRKQLLTRILTSLDDDKAEDIVTIDLAAAPRCAMRW